MCCNSLGNAACKARASYYIVSSTLSGPTMFFHIIIDRQYDFRKKVIEHKMRVMIFSAVFV